jgi:hypothetical protein
MKIDDRNTPLLLYIACTYRLYPSVVYCPYICTDAASSYNRHPLSLFLEIDQTQFGGYIPPLARRQFNEIQRSFRNLSMRCIVPYLILLISLN